MVVSIEQLVKKISLEYEKSLKFFRDLPEPLWQTTLYSDGEEWTVHQVLAHIVEAEGSYFDLFFNISQGGIGADEDFDINRHNAEEVSKISKKTRDELLFMFNERRSRILNLVQKLSPDQLSNLGHHPYLGNATLEEMLRLYLLHINLHLRDIRKIMTVRR